MTGQPFLSIIVPVYNGGHTFTTCLSALKEFILQDWELIVVDDGSTDQSAIVAEQLRAIVLKTHGRLGPGAARNLGAQVAKGEYLCFVDADCEVHADTLTTLAQTLNRHPEVDAVFGSYDDTPKASNFVAQYKNLFHHYIHQVSKREASTFWAGFGAVKRSTFLNLNGFNVQRYGRPSIEDIELGYRIKQAGGRIHLAKQVQVKHHKAWSLRGLIKTDILYRGIPWTRLLLSQQSNCVNDLNLGVASRISVIATSLFIPLLLASFFRAEIASLLLANVILLLLLNLEIYYFFYKRRGLAFSIKAIFMHWLYYFYSGISLMLGTLLHLQELIVTKSKSNRKFGRQFADDSIN